MAKGTSNRHREFRDGDLSRRWLRRHERAEIPSAAEDRDDKSDDWCCPYPWCHYCEWHWLHFELWRAWQDMQTVGFASSLGVPGAWIGRGWVGEPLPDASVVFGDDVAAALHQHIRLIASQAGRAAYRASAPWVAAVEQLRPMLRRYPRLFEWFEGGEGCSGAGIMTILLAPFWIRPLETWSAPDSDDSDALGRSLIDHLLVRYPVPEALYQPWEREEVPNLKWVSWLVLIGRGASVPRAGSRFGWAVSSKRLAQLRAAPSGLMPVEALIWAEVMNAGGSELEFDRLRQHPGYLFDPTTTAARTRFRLESDLEDDGVDSAPSRRFLQATVGWLVRHRADLIYPFPTDRILHWALHRHTEDLAREVPERKRFSWRGRTPVSARDAALEYDRQLEDAQRRGRELSWRPRGWDRDLPAEDGVWTVRELTSSAELSLESQAMQHCVASYDHRCAQGASAIFSLAFDGSRHLTVELEPRSRRIVQARGLQNRGAEPRELEVLRRWLDSLADATPKPGS